MADSAELRIIVKETPPVEGPPRQVERREPQTTPETPVVQQVTPQAQPTPKEPSLVPTITDEIGIQRPDHTDTIRRTMQELGGGDDAVEALKKLGFALEDIKKAVQQTAPTQAQPTQQPQVSAPETQAPIAQPKQPNQVLSSDQALETARKQMEAERTARANKQLVEQMRLSIDADMRRQKEDDEDPMVQARKQMEAERAKDERDRLTRNMRLAIDPDFRKRESERRQDELAQGRQEGQSRTAQTMATASMGVAALGMGNVAGLLGGISAGLAAGSIPGAVIGGATAALKIFTNVLEESTQRQMRINTAIAGFNWQQASRELTEFIGQLPVVGGYLKSYYGGILDMGESLMSEARRLSGYNPQLAQQMANIELRNLQRDITRAQNFGPQMARGVDAYYAFQERIQAFLDKNFPTIMRIMEAGLAALEKWLPALELQMRLQSGELGTAGEILGALGPGFRSIAGFFAPGMLSNLVRIAQNTTPPPTEVVGNRNLDALLGRLGVGESDANRALREDRNRVGRTPQPMFGGF